MKNTFLAVDFGGGSGRVMAGYIIDKKLCLEEIYRFKNRQIRLGKHLYWDFPALFEDMKGGIRKAAQRKDLNIQSIGIDTWGVDFGFVDKHGNLLSLPMCYRDERTKGLSEDFIKTHDVRKHYSQSGIQMMDINSIYQLISMKREKSPILDMAENILFMPDLFSFFLTGKANCEYTIASTSELLDAKTRNWNKELISELGLRNDIFPEIVMPGSVRGTLTKDVAEDLGLTTDVKVVAVGSHDTQSASYTASDYPSAFISSGTWSLLGVAIDEPILNENARTSGFSNEGGVGGKINLLQNITGLWFLQRLIAQWEERGENVSYDRILPLAEQSDIDTVLDVDDPIFTNPRDMDQTICDYCKVHKMQVPKTIGEKVKVVLQSLAHRYAKGIQDLNSLLQKPIKQINIIGGGSQNKVLNRLTELVTNLPVVAGPVEATAIGNILVQAIACGEIKDKQEIIYK